MSSAIGKPCPDSFVPGPEERLDSWEGIAAYLRRSVRSARRWEKEEGLPVHRQGRGKTGSVYAYREELDGWWINEAGPEPATDSRLDSWKEIASHLHGSERSARRWEKEEGLPVHRHTHGKGDSIYAYKTQLDDWLNSRRSKPSDQDEEKIARVSSEQARGGPTAVFE